MPEPVAVRGLAELQRDFRKLSKDLNSEVRGELRAVAEPVATDAERLAVEKISGMRRQAERGRTPVRWARMRIGVTQKLVYVAPKEHGRRGGHKNPAFGDYLAGQAMEPAWEKHQHEIEGRLGRMFDRLARRNGF